MSNKEKIIEISLKVNDLKSKYVLIHDEIFRTSIRQIIPLPWIFKSIDFGAHLDRVKNIITELESCDPKIKSLIETANVQEREYLNLLHRYLEALNETVHYFKTVVGALYAKSQNFVNSNYDWKNYKSDLETHDKAMKNYMTIGRSLNGLFDKIKRDDFHDE